MNTNAPRTNELAPPTERIPMIRWLHQNLFNSWFNAILTVVATIVIAAIVFGLGHWALTAARWEVIPANLKVLFVGTYPAEQLWRVWMTVILIGLITGFSGGLRSKLMGRIALVVTGVALLLGLLPFPLGTQLWILGVAAATAGGIGLGLITRNLKTPWTRRIEISAWLASLPISILLLNGIGGVLPVVEGRTQWGFLLNLLGAIAGIALSLPIGILLALGRRSKLPAVRWVCTAYIEIIRGVPLISLLFMASIMLQLLLPDHIRPDLLVRAMVTIIAFSAAYMAENVRGGLQSISQGQFEAAHALGLGKVLTTVLIILPQALRAVIPAIVGQFIALFKDTTLFGFIAILELLSLSRSVVGNLEWRGTIFELYVFIGILFWALCYSMSYTGRSIERALGVGRQ